MQEEEYTFVTLDGNDVMPADAVIIDVEGGGVDLDDAIVIDDSSIESFDHSVLYEHWRTIRLCFPIQI